MHAANKQNRAMTFISHSEIHSLQTSLGHAAVLQTFRCTENFECLKDLIHPHVLLLLLTKRHRLRLFETAPSTGPTVHPPDDTWQLRSLSRLGKATCAYKILSQSWSAPGTNSRPHGKNPVTNLWCRRLTCRSYNFSAVAWPFSWHKRVAGK